MQYDFSIIIVSYNSSALVIDLLKSIFLFESGVGVKYECVIVDNSEEIDQNLFLFANKFENVTYIKSEKNGGFGYGNNIGFNHSTGKNLLFLNPDTKFIEPVLEYLLNIMQTYSQASLFGCFQVSPDGMKEHSYGIMPEKRNVYSVIKYKILGKYLLKKPRVDIFPWGSFMALSRGKFIAAGMFDEDIFLNYEEADLASRLKSEVFLINRRIIHYNGKSKQSNLLQTNEIKADNGKKVKKDLDVLLYYLKKSNKRILKIKINYVSIKIFKSIYNLILFRYAEAGNDFRYIYYLLFMK